MKHEMKSSGDHSQMITRRSDDYSQPVYRNMDSVDENTQHIVHRFMNRYSITEIVVHLLTFIQ